MFIACPDIYHNWFSFLIKFSKIELPWILKKKNNFPNPVNCKSKAKLFSPSGSKKKRPNPLFIARKHVWRKLAVQKVRAKSAQLLIEYFLFLWGRTSSVSKGAFLWPILGSACQSTLTWGARSMGAKCRVEGRTPPPANTAIEGRQICPLGCGVFYFLSCTAWRKSKKNCWWEWVMCVHETK